MYAKAIPELPGRSKPYVMAHRGAKNVCPENTMAAFKQAVADGADMIETDLQVTSDGKFVCIHDATINRTTNGVGEVATMSLRKIKQYRATKGFDNFEDERIPTLEETLDFLPEDRALFLELKANRFLEKKHSQRLFETLRASGKLERIGILSFSLRRIKAVQAVSRDLLTGWISMTKPWREPGVQVLGPFWPLLYLNPRYVQTAQAQGQAVCPLDVTPEKRLPYYLKLGCDAILTNHPATTCRRLEELQRAGSAVNQA